ncbi:Y-family DNA polymerase [Teichococcus vastitatis]|uniref:DNA polymerase Y family protein n=1 Tax=Teichococcus vastitatis TaxID=2307076 RepID=A0ABS9W6E1_9PROT|nr:DNA polymerase Y family protein [Pseudoroseomonas vastitatis]MCI0754864.1 DNA polymerase Y family protein [Pseudoroseomonas vastitatis]
MSRRCLALVLPELALDRLRRQHPELQGRPFAVWSSSGPRRLLSAAAAPGLWPGQALADAQAIHPDLPLFEAAPAADAALLERLALWALRFTPLATVDGTDGLLLDITGVAGLSGGEAALLEAVLGSFRAGGYRAVGAIADAPGSAAALARCPAAPRILPPGTGAEALAALPLPALRLPAALLHDLAWLGLHTLGDALRQPRAPLARRFGRALLDALDAASGARSRPLRPVRPPPVFAAARELPEPIVTRPAIDRVLALLLDELCAVLARSGQGAQRLLLRAFPGGSGGAGAGDRHRRRLAQPGALRPTVRAPARPAGAGSRLRAKGAAGDRHRTPYWAILP